MPDSDSTLPPDTSEKAPLQVADRSDLYDLWLASQRAPDWVLEDLIMMGDQVMLSGAPKTYKSFFASHLAIALAFGYPEFLNWTIPAPRKVLFLSMEMREGLAAARVVHQARSLAKMDFKKQPEAEIRAVPLIHRFALYGRQSINILDDRDFLVMHKLIERENPDVVIFDSFIRFHHADENINPHMSEVMQRMRDVCAIDPPRSWLERQEEDDKLDAPEPLQDSIRYRTSIIIHHNRKEAAGNSFTDYSAASMRGASAIHSEADLVIATFPLKEKNVSMNFSARKIKEPDFEVYGLNEKTLLLEIREKKVASSKVSKKSLRLPYVIDVLLEARDDNSTDGGTYLSWKAIQEKVCDTPGSPDYHMKLDATTYAKAFNHLFRRYYETKRDGNGSVYRLNEDVSREQLLDDLTPYVK